MSSPTKLIKKVSNNRKHFQTQVLNNNVIYDRLNVMT